MDSRLFIRFDKRALSKFTRDGLLILSEDEKVIYIFKGVAELVCKMADGKKRVSDVISAITEEFDIDKDTAGRDVMDFLEKVTKEDASLFKFCKCAI